MQDKIIANKGCFTQTNSFEIKLHFYIFELSAIQSLYVMVKNIIIIFLVSVIFIPIWIAMYLLQTNQINFAMLWKINSKVIQFVHGPLLRTVRFMCLLFSLPYQHLTLECFIVMEIYNNMLLKECKLEAFSWHSRPWAGKDLTIQCQTCCDIRH